MVSSYRFASCLHLNFRCFAYPAVPHPTQLKGARAACGVGGGLSCGQFRSLSAFHPFESFLTGDIFLFANYQLTADQDAMLIIFGYLELAWGSDYAENYTLRIMIRYAVPLVLGLSFRFLTWFASQSPGRGSIPRRGLVT